MLPLLFNMQNLPLDTDTTTNAVYFFFAWPNPLMYRGESVGS